MVESAEVASIGGLNVMLQPLDNLRHVVLALCHFEDESVLAFFVPGEVGLEGVGDNSR